MGPVHLSPAKGTGLYLWSIFPPVCIFLGHSGILGTRVSWHLVGRTHHALGGNPGRPEHSPSPFAAAAAVGGVPVSRPPPLPCSCSFRAGAVICLFTSVSSFPFRRCCFVASPEGFSPSVSPPVSSKPKASSPLTLLPPPHHNSGEHLGFRPLLGSPVLLLCASPWSGDHGVIRC